MTKSEIIADIVSKSLTRGDLRSTGSGGLTDILRYSQNTVILDNGEAVNKEYNFYVYKEGTADENAYYVRTDE